MRDATETGDGGTSRMRWNDIRIVGPVLVLALFVAVLVNPQFASSEQSVGADSGTSHCFDMGSESDSASATAGAAVQLTSDCCLETTTTTAVGAIFPPCEPKPVIAPAVPLIPPPDAIIGPIWLGATKSTLVVSTITLQPPRMLAIFIGDNDVVVTNSSDAVVFHGPLSAGDTMLFSGDAGVYTMTTTLRTGAKYTEVIVVGVVPLN